MVVNAILGGAYVIATLYDLVTTHRRVLKYGIGIETNAPLRGAIQRFGLIPSLAGLGIGHLALVLGLITIDPSHVILSFLTGARMVFMAFQVESLKLENSLDELIALGKAKVPGRGDAASPSDCDTP